MDSIFNCQVSKHFIFMLKFNIGKGAIVEIFLNKLLKLTDTVFLKISLILQVKSFDRRILILAIYSMKVVRAC